MMTGYGFGVRNGWLGLRISFGLLLAATVGLSQKASSAYAEQKGMPRIQVSRDGRHFETASGIPFVPFGVTYFRPGTGWAPQVWKKFDPQAVEQDFLLMRKLGINCVRVFLTFDSFLPTTNGVSEEGLKKLDRFLEIAEKAGIYVHPTGPDHWEGTPDWARTDRMADENFLKALEMFWRQLAQRYRGRSVVFAYDLLNEPMVGWDTPVLRVKWNAWLQTNYGSATNSAKVWGVSLDQIQWTRQAPPEAKDSLTNRCLLDYQRFREEVADAWTQRQSTAIKSVDPDALVTVGMIQWSVPVLLPVVSHYAAFNPQRQARYLDFLEVHFYPLEHGFFEYASPESEARNLAYLESVVREVAAAGKPLVLAEFGWYGGGKLTIDQGRHPAATEAQQAQWCRRAIETTRGLACGWLNWGLYDHSEAGDVTQKIGLLGEDGHAKEWGQAFEELSKQGLSKLLSEPPQPIRPKIDWNACITSKSAADDYRRRYYQAYSKSATKPD
jgi:hypothetical protein